MPIKQSFISFFAILSITSNVYAYDLRDYLTEVQGKNKSVKATESSIIGTYLRINESRLLFSPNFFLNAQQSNDKRPTIAPSFQGTQTIRKFYSAGLSQQLRTGTKATFSYNYTQTIINGTTPGVLPRSNFYDLSPQLEISQSLWRNLWGRETKATEEAMKSQVEATHYSERYKMKQLIMNAELNYWRLVFAQRNVAVQKQSLDRALTLRELTLSRLRKGLGDESDYMQAEAAIKARELDFKNALIDIQSAERAFNSLREVEKGNEELMALPDEAFLGLTVPERKGNREDVEASLASKNMASANAILGRERNQPNLEVYASYALNGRDGSASGANNQAWDGERPYSIVGVRFNTPLDLYNLGSNKEGYTQEKMAADLTYERKLFEQEKEWQELNYRFEDYKERLKLSMAMEKVQKEKLFKEKERLKKGRSMTFQILQFEQDYANAVLTKIKNQSELISTFTQLKLFSEVNDARK